MVKYVPERADVVWLEFDPQKGKEINKVKPAVVISPQSYNAKTGLALFMPITSQVKNYPFELAINSKAITGVILCDQLRSFDWRARNAKKITQITEKEMTEALARLGVLLE
jgi:mRNA interferase MazF